LIAVVILSQRKE